MPTARLRRQMKKCRISVCAQNRNRTYLSKMITYCRVAGVGVHRAAVQSAGFLTGAKQSVGSRHKRADRSSASGLHVVKRSTVYSRPLDRDSMCQSVEGDREESCGPVWREGKVPARNGFDAFSSYGTILMPTRLVDNSTKRVASKRRLLVQLIGTR